MPLGKQIYIFPVRLASYSKALALLMKSGEVFSLCVLLSEQTLFEQRSQSNICYRYILYKIYLMYINMYFVDIYII